LRLLAFRTVVRTLKEILKRLTVMGASQAEMSASLRLDRLVFREKTNVLNQSAVNGVNILGKRARVLAEQRSKQD